MTETKRRYTSVDGKEDYVVGVSYNEALLDTAQWFEAGVTAQNERTGDKIKLPPEMARYRIGEIEHTFKQFVALDFGGDREAALSHHLDTIFRRIYFYLERGH